MASSSPESYMGLLGDSLHEKLTKSRTGDTTLAQHWKVAFCIDAEPGITKEQEESFSAHGTLSIFVAFIHRIGCKVEPADPGHKV
jgi:hypothetical protein